MTLGPVRMMGAGVVLTPCVEEVRIVWLIILLAALNYSVLAEVYY